MARGGKLQAWVERSEDVFAGTCHASFPKAQLHSSEEAAVDASRALPSLVLPPSAVLPLCPAVRSLPTDRLFGAKRLVLCISVHF